MVKACLAVVIIGFSLYSLFGRSIVLESEIWAGLFLCGLFAGIFGGAYGLNGPLLVVYGSMRRLSVQHFGATLQCFFLSVRLVGLACYCIKGLWAISVPAFYRNSVVWGNK